MAELADAMDLGSIGNPVQVRPLLSAPQGHTKGAYKTPPRVSFSMQNSGKLPFSWQFTLFVVSSHIAVGICFSLA